MTIFEIRDQLSSIEADGQTLTLVELDSLAAAVKLSCMKAISACMKTINDCFATGKQAAAEMAQIRSCAEECSRILRALSAKE